MKFDLAPGVAEYQGWQARPGVLGAGGWQPVGDFTRGEASNGGKVEITGEKDVSTTCPSNVPLMLTIVRLY